VIQIGFLKEAGVNGTTLRNVFFLHDNGIGIAEVNHERIFRIFTRLNREAEYGRGTGAGLSFVKKIIEEYGGAITLASKPGDGTTFYFSLPVVASNTQIKSTERGTNSWTQLQLS
jgi:signal transduction histidine kinase